MACGCGMAGFAGVKKRKAAKKTGTRKVAKRRVARKATAGCDCPKPVKKGTTVKTLCKAAGVGKARKAKRATTAGKKRKTRKAA